MLDSYNRKINYLRISITDRCNLRCTYCMPETGIKQYNHDDILKFEEIRDFLIIAAKNGINKIRLTGGEPLVRKGILTLVEMLSHIEGIEDFALTTNGILLNNFAFPLKKAGLHRINISLDTINPIKYALITRGGDITKVFEGIEAAKHSGLLPIKINCVINKSSEEKDAKEVSEFCKKNNLSIRFIHKMDLKKGEFTTVEGGDGGNCIACNRLRLTANGKLKPCLFNDLEFDIRELGYEQAFNLAVKLKPKCGKVNNINAFNNIGG